MLMVGFVCGLEVDNVITMAALSRQIDGAGAVSWCGTGSPLKAEQHHVCRGIMNVIYYRDNILRNHVISFFHQYRDMHTFQQDNARATTARVTIQYLANSNGILLEWLTLIYRQ